MNYTEYKSLDISEAEKGAVQRYVSNAHISMNALLDIDPEVINAQLEKGWVIDFSKDGVKRNIEYLTKLYSAMYKYSLSNSVDGITVHRGTTVDEVDKLQRNNVSGRFLSTSRDENIAMRFTEYKRGALFTMYIKDAPCIPTDEFLDETQVSEEEYLVAPYSKIERVEKYGIQEIDGVTKYSAAVKKQEFQNITDEERKEYDEIISNFDFEDNLEKYKELSFKYEIMTARIDGLSNAKTKDEKEELEYMRERHSELSKELSEIKNGFIKVKTAMTKMLQDKFKTVELEIEKGIEQDKSELEEKKRIEKIEGEKQRKNILLNNADQIIAEIDSVKEKYTTYDEEEQKLYKKAEELGVDRSNKNDVVPETVSKFDELKQGIEKIKQEIDSLDINDDMTKEDLDVKGTLNKKINELTSKLDITSRMLTECEGIISSQRGKANEKISKSIAERLGQDITDKASADLLKEEQELASKKVSIFDRITGKSKVRLAQLESLRLKRAFVEGGGLKLPNNLEEMTTFAAKYKAVLGEESLPESVKGILPEDISNITITNEEIDILETARAGTSLMPVKGNNKELLGMLSGKNETLKEKIQHTNLKGTDVTETLNFQVKGSLDRCLDAALYYTTDMPEEQKEKIMKDMPTL